METLSKRNEAKDSARDGLGVEDGCEECVYDVVRSLCFSGADVGSGLMIE